VDRKGGLSCKGGAAAPGRGPAFSLFRQDQILELFFIAVGPEVLFPLFLFSYHDLLSFLCIFSGLSRI
jgi:hypothetical protein